MNKKVKGEKAMEYTISETVVPGSSLKMGYLRILNEVSSWAMSISERRSIQAEKRASSKSQGQKNPVCVQGTVRKSVLLERRWESRGWGRSIKEIVKKHQWGRRETESAISQKPEGKRVLRKEGSKLSPMMLNAQVPFFSPEPLRVQLSSQVMW